MVELDTTPGWLFSIHTSSSNGSLTHALKRCDPGLLQGRWCRVAHSSASGLSRKWIKREGDGRDDQPDWLDKSTDLLARNRCLFPLPDITSLRIKEVDLARLRRCWNQLETRGRVG